MSYGVNILPESAAKELLLEKQAQVSGVNYWKEQLGHAGNAYAAQTAALTTDYSEAIAQAYASNLKNRNAIDSAALSKGSAAEASAISRADLMNTFNTYLSNYSSALASAKSNYESNVSSIEGALDTNASNYSKLYGKYAYDYLVNELGKSKLGTDDTATGALSNSYLDWLYDTDASGNYLTDSSGNNVIKDISKLGLTDEDGNITEKGLQFYDAAFNFSPNGYTYTDSATNTTRSTRSFDEWLSEVDPDLREWWASPDYTNYTARGTKGASVRQALGGKLSDYIYNAREKDYRQASGASEKISKDIDDKFESLYNRIETNKFSSRVNYTDGAQLDVYSKDVKNLEKNSLALLNETDDEVTRISNILKSSIEEDEYEEFMSKLSEIEKPSKLNYVKSMKFPVETRANNNYDYVFVSDLKNYTNTFNKNLQDYYKKVVQLAKSYL